MLPHRIKELRIERGLTVSELAERVDLSHTQVSRIENGKRGLSIPVAERMAKAMNTTVADVIGANAGPKTPTDKLVGFHNDAEPYDAGPSDIPVRPVRGKNIDPWRVKTNALDLAGISVGMVVFVDLSAEAVEGVKPLQCVIAQVYGGMGDKTLTVIRQFVPPSLLITNSSDENTVPLDLSKGEAYIKGVIVGKYQGF